VYASARLYIVPGRPAWDTKLTVVRFFASAAAIGPALAGRPGIAATGVAVALLATVCNWQRLGRHAEPPYAGALHLELHWFRAWTATRFVLALATIVAALAGMPDAVVFAGAAVSELIGRWLFYTAVVPLNMPGAFWRGAAGAHR
jgi:DMSO reductase anchor subunit